MKHSILLAGLVLSLGACQKSDNSEDIAPAAISAAFDQSFTLDYRQQAILPTASQPELTVEIVDFDYAFCPKNACCFVADFVAPTLAVTDSQGQTQQVKMAVRVPRMYSPDFIDTTSVRANGRRYLLQYTKWNTPTNSDQPQKKDISVVLRVTKLTGN